MLDKIVYKRVSELYKYRVTSCTWPCISGTLYKLTCPVYASKVAYLRHVTFYEVQEKHDHVYLVGLYNIVLRVKSDEKSVSKVLIVRLRKQTWWNHLKIEVFDSFSLVFSCSIKKTWSDKFKSLCFGPNLIFTKILYFSKFVNLL